MKRTILYIFKPFNHNKSLRNEFMTSKVKINQTNKQMICHETASYLTGLLFSFSKFT